MNAPIPDRAILRMHAASVQARHPLTLTGLLPRGSAAAARSDDALDVLAEKRRGSSLPGLPAAGGRAVDPRRTSCRSGAEVRLAGAGRGGARTARRTGLMRGDPERIEDALDDARHPSHLMAPRSRLVHADRQTDIEGVTAAVIETDLGAPVASLDTLRAVLQEAQP